MERRKRTLRQRLSGAAPEEAPKDKTSGNGKGTSEEEDRAKAQEEEEEPASGTFIACFVGTSDVVATSVAKCTPAWRWNSCSVGSYIRRYLSV